VEVLTSYGLGDAPVSSSLTMIAVFVSAKAMVSSPQTVTVRIISESLLPKVALSLMKVLKPAVLTMSR